MILIKEGVRAQDIVTDDFFGPQEGDLIDESKGRFVGEAVKNMLVFHIIRGSVMRPGFLPAVFAAIYRNNGAVYPGCLIQAKQIDRTRDVFRPGRPSQRIPASGEVQEAFAVR